MTTYMCTSMVNISRLSYFHARNICTSRLLQDVKWRERNGLPINHNAYGPLTDRPDYSYLDGRPTPVGPRLRTRLQKQREIAEKIIQFTKEIDFAVQRHEQVQLEAENARKKILDNKLKPKGGPFRKNNPAKE